MEEASLQLVTIQPRGLENMAADAAQVVRELDPQMLGKQWFVFTGDDATNALIQACQYLAGVHRDQEQLDEQFRQWRDTWEREGYDPLVLSGVQVSVVENPL